MGIRSEAMDWPKEYQIQAASQVQLGRWIRYLPSPVDDEQQAKLATIQARFKGWTPFISKAIGWTNRGRW